MATQDYQRKIFITAVKRLLAKQKVGLDVFTRGGKSYIAMDIIEYMLSRDDCKGKYVLILGPKTILDNLRDNVMSKFKYKKRLLYLNYEKLSRQLTITEFLDSQNIKKDAIELIVMDEAHKAFGEQCRKTFLEDIDFINSKYLVAMTATPYSNLSGINSLDELVGENNSIRYHYDEAIKDKVARKINYIPAILSYDTNVLDKLVDIRKNCNDNDYLIQLLDRFEKLHGELTSNESKAITSYITENINLDLSNGARVFVFFSSIEKLEAGKETVVSAITQAYKNWGNKPVKHRYMNFTSASSEEEIDEIRGKLAKKPLKNTVDIVCTVQMGVMGIHPSNTHFALIMSATTSLPKLMQMMGRVTNLYKYDDADTTIFDLKDCLKAIGSVRYNVTTKDLLNDLLNCMYSDDEADIDKYSSMVNIKSSKITNDSLELLAKIQYIADTVKEVDTVLDYIYNELKDIDAKKSGNILEYLKSKRLYSYKDYERRSILRIEGIYKSLLNIAFSDNYDNDIKNTIKQKLNTLEYRIYILETYDTEQCMRVRNSYRICKETYETGVKTDKLTKYVITPIVLDESLTGIKRIVKDFDIMKLFSDEELQKLKDSVLTDRYKREEAKRAAEEEDRRRKEAERLENEKRYKALKEEEIKKKEERKAAREKQRLLREKEHEVEKIKDSIRYAKRIINEAESKITDIEHKIHNYNHNATDIYCKIKITINNNRIDLVKINTRKISIENMNQYISTVKKNIDLVKYSTEEIENTLDSMSEETSTTDSINAAINEIIRDLRNEFNANKESIKVIEKFISIAPIHIKNLDNMYEEISSIKSIHVVNNDIIHELRNKFNINKYISLKCKSIEEFNDYKDKLQLIIGEPVLCDKANKSYDYRGTAEYTYKEIMEKYANTDYMVALFITILSKTVKEIHYSGGYTIDTRLDNGDVSQLEYALKSRVGIDNGLEIIKRADEYKNRHDVKLLLDIAYDNFSHYNTDRMIEEYANIVQQDDIVLNYLNTILNLGELETNGVIRKIRNKRGFRFYHEVLKIVKEDSPVLKAIYEEMEKDIKETFGVALYYAIDLNDEAIEKEIFGTNKYDEQINKYVQDGEEKLSKVKGSLEKYNKRVKLKKAKAKSEKSKS